MSASYRLEEGPQIKTVTSVLTAMKKKEQRYELRGYESQLHTYLGSLSIIRLTDMFTTYFCNCLIDCVLPSEAWHRARSSLML